MLSSAAIADCNLSQANLEKTQLDGVTFTNCDVWGTLFTDATGLEEAQKNGWEGMAH